MIKSIILLVVIGGGLACTIVLFNRQKTPPAPAPIVESTPAPVSAPLEEIAASKPELPPPISANASAAVKVSTATPVVGEAKPDDSAAPIRKAVDALLSAKTAAEKHAAFQ